MKEAREQLLNNGTVYTFRKNYRQVGKDWATDKRGGKKICDVYIRFVKTVYSPEDLEFCVLLSGFKDLKSWVEAIHKTAYSTKKEFSGYLYSVERR